MKFYVDNIPKYPENCPFAKWIPNPPILEKPGEWKCELNNSKCYVYKTECKMLIELPRTYSNEQEENK